MAESKHSLEGRLQGYKASIITPAFGKGLVVCALLAGLSACGPKGGAGMGKMGPGGMVMPVPTAIAQETSVADTTDYVATLISRHSVQIQPQIEGIVTRINVQAGDVVGAGTALLQIDPMKQQASVNAAAEQAESLRADIEQSQRNLDVSVQEYKASESNLTFAQNQFQRYQNLFKQEFVSRESLDQHEDAYNKAKADLASSQAKIEALKAAVNASKRRFQQAVASTREQQVQLHYYQVTAPFTGVVGDIPVKLGNFVNPNTMLLSVTENNPLEANVRIPAEKTFNLRMGAPLQLLDDNNQVIAESKVSFIAPNVDEKTQTVLIKAIFANATGLLKADEKLSARLVWKTFPGVLVPTSAVVHLAGQDFVYVAARGPKGYMAQQRAVVLGQIVGTNYAVLKGLQPHELVITGGIQKLADGAPVKPAT